MTKEKKDVYPTVFEEKEVRRTWYDEQWFFSITDVVAILSESPNSRRYWSDLKGKLISEGYSELYEKIVQLKLQSSDGKKYETDSSNLSGIFRIIQSIPSPKAEPFKQWLSRVGQERIEEIQDPERAIVRAKKIYEQKGYNDDWIAKRMRGINVRNTLTDEWKGRGAKEGFDFVFPRKCGSSNFNRSHSDIDNIGPAYHCGCLFYYSFCFLFSSPAFLLSICLCLFSIKDSSRRKSF